MDLDALIELIPEEHREQARGAVEAHVATTVAAKVTSDYGKPLRQARSEAQRLAHEKAELEADLANLRTQAESAGSLAETHAALKASHEELTGRFGAIEAEAAGFRRRKLYDLLAEAGELSDPRHAPWLAEELGLSPADIVHQGEDGRVTYALSDEHRAKIVAKVGSPQARASLVREGLRTVQRGGPPPVEGPAKTGLDRMLETASPRERRILLAQRQ